MSIGLVSVIGLIVVPAYFFVLLAAVYMIRDWIDSKVRISYRTDADGVTRVDYSEAHTLFGKIICVLGASVMLAGIAAVIYVARSGYGDYWVNYSLELGNELGYIQELNFAKKVEYYILMYRVQLAIGGAVAAVIGYLVAIWDRLNINIHIEKKGN